MHRRQRFATWESTTEPLGAFRLRLAVQASPSRDDADFAVTAIVSDVTHTPASGESVDARRIAATNALVATPSAEETKMNGFDRSRTWRALAVTVVGLFIVASAAQEPEQTQALPFIPSASDTLDRQGFVRVTTRNAPPGIGQCGKWNLPRVSGCPIAVSLVEDTASGVRRSSAL